MNIDVNLRDVNTNTSEFKTSETTGGLKNINVVRERERDLDWT